MENIPKVTTKIGTEKDIDLMDFLFQEDTGKWYASTGVVYRSWSDYISPAVEAEVWQTKTGQWRYTYIIHYGDFDWVTGTLEDTKEDAIRECRDMIKWDCNKLVKGE